MIDGSRGYGFGSYSGTSTTVGPPTVIPAHLPALMVMDEQSMLRRLELAYWPTEYTGGASKS
jgi:hypothetical protein